jgi:hypothetical protein
MYNRDNGLDFHLKILGIEDRQNWELICVDNQEYRNKHFVCRPDWALHNIETGEYRVADYKSRYLRAGKPNAYEKAQVAINAMVVKDHLQLTKGIEAKVTAMLVYGDGQIRIIPYEPWTVDWVTRQAERLHEPLVIAGMLPSRMDKIPVTLMAKLIADDTYTTDPVEAREAGVEAHYVITKAGPRPPVTLH